MTFINSLNNYLLNATYESNSLLDTVNWAITEITKMCFILEFETSRSRKNINKQIYNRSVCGNSMKK